MVRASVLSEARHRLKSDTPLKREQDPWLSTFFFSLSPFCRRFEDGWGRLGAIGGDWGRLGAIFDESGTAKCLKSSDQAGLLHIEQKFHLLRNHR